MGNLSGRLVMVGIRKIMRHFTLIVLFCWFYGVFAGATPTQDSPESAEPELTIKVGDVQIKEQQETDVVRIKIKYHSFWI